MNLVGMRSKYETHQEPFYSHQFKDIHYIKNHVFVYVPFLFTNLRSEHLTQQTISSSRT